MGASSSGLLDEAKISNIKGLVDSKFQSFSVFYRQQYSAAYSEHLHQEMEPKKEGRGLLLTHGPQYAPEEVLYHGTLKFSCWDEQGKKCRERYVVLRRDYKVEIHENLETFNRGGAAKLVLQPAGGSVYTTEEESRAHLEQTCAGILNGVKEDSSSVVSSPDVFSVYLHLPYTGHTCFLFQAKEERDHFLSALRTCIRHGNLDPWVDPSYESQAYVRALRLYRQDKGCYESWEMLFGTEEQVLACQVMEEVLPWLQSQLQSRVKGKKTERIRQWLATVQATQTLVLEQLTGSLEALRDECRQTASANQTLIRSNLDQIVSSQRFLEEKVRACICEEAEKVCSEAVTPYMSSILEALTENIGAGIQGMRHTLHTQMDSAFAHTNGGAKETKKVLSTLRSISLDQSYRQVEKLTEKCEGLKQRFGLSNTESLVHSAHLEMEKLLDSAVYTLELFLQSSARLQPAQIPVKMERAKERVLKQLEHDSRVVQRRLYHSALLKITLPALTRRMDSKWKAELQQFEQYIFSDYSCFILVHNVYDDVLRNILSKNIDTVVQDAAGKKSNNLFLDTSDLAMSQYSLLGQTPPRSAPDSPAVPTRDPTSSSSSAPPPSEEPGAAPAVEVAGQQTIPERPRSEPELNAGAKAEPSSTQSPDQNTVLVSPAIVVTQQLDESPSTREEVRQLGTDTTVSPADSTITTTVSLNSATPDSMVTDDAAATHEASTTPDAPASLESTHPTADPPNPSVSTLSTNVPADCAQSDQSTLDLSTSDQVKDDTATASEQQQQPCPSACHPPCADGPMPSLDTASTADSTTTVSLNSATPLSDDAREASTTPDATASLESNHLTADSPNLSVSTLSTDVPADCAQSDQSTATPDSQAATTPNLSTSDQVKDDTTTSVQQKPCPSACHPPCADGPMPSLDTASTTDSTTTASLNSATPDSNDAAAAATHEASTTSDAPASPESTHPTADPPNPSVSTLSTDGPVECAQSDQSTATPNSQAATTPNLSTCPPHCADGPMKISLGSLSEAIGCNSSAPPVMQAAPQRTTDRAVYLTGGIKDNWEMKRVKGEEVEVEEEAHNEGCPSSECPAESAIATEQREGEETGGDGELKTEKRKDREEAKETGDDADKHGKKEREDEELLLQSPQPMGLKPDGAAELLLGSVSIIRELVTEVTEVETLISPCPTNSPTP